MDNFKPIQLFHSILKQHNLVSPLITSKVVVLLLILHFLNKDLQAKVEWKRKD